MKIKLEIPLFFAYICTSINLQLTSIDDIMVSMLAVSAVKPKTIELVFAASMLTMQHKGARTKSGRLHRSTMFLSGATCLLVFIETQCV